MLNLVEGEIYYSIEDLKGYEVATKRNGYWYLCCFKGTSSSIKHVWEKMSVDDFEDKFVKTHLDAMEANWQRQKKRALQALEVVKELRKERTDASFTS